MNNMSIILRFKLLVGLMFLMVLVGTAIVTFSSSRLTQTAHGMAEKEIPILNKAHELKFSVVQVQQWLTDISATRGLDGLNDGYDEAETHAQDFRRLIRELRELDPEHDRRYQEMLPAFEDYYRVGKQMAAAYIEQGPAGGNKMMGEFDKVAEVMAEKIDSYVELVVQNSDQTISAHAGEIDQAQLLLVFGFFAMLATIVLAYVSLSRPVRRLPVVVEELQAIAAGDLSHPVKAYGSQDEVGQLFQALEKMKTQLRTLISELAETSSEVNGEARQINAVMDQSSEALNTQAMRLNQMATAITEMSSTVNEVAQGAQNTANETSKVDAEMVQGMKSIDQVAEEMLKLSTEVEGAAQVVQALNDKSNHIGGILDVIRTIAEQTNLLALNAAIEAARAGEQGRGFAVVADEVRTLAQRTQASISDIQNMIEELQGGANQAVSAISKGKSRAAGTVAQVERAKHNLHSITSAVSRITDMSQQIATATEEQSAVSNEMNANILDIKASSEQQTEGMEQLVGSSRHLCEMAEHLQKNMARFRL